MTEKPGARNSGSTTVEHASSEHTPSSTSNEKGKSKGFLGFVERVGNKLPHPFWLFVILGGITLVASWIGSRIGMSATQPDTGDTVEVVNLLTRDGLQQMVSDAVNNFVTFPPLGVILVAMLGVAVAEHSGLLSAAVRGMVSKTGPRTLTFVVALAGVTGSVASDAVYVIVIPLGAMAFYALGRSPIVGAMVAFAASSAGFNASLVLNITDLLLAGISTSAAQLVDENYEVSGLANIFFVIPSAIVLALIITAVTEFFVEKKARQLINHDEINEKEVSFGDEVPTNEEERLEQLKLDDHEKKALKVTGLVLLGLLAVYFALLFVPGSPFVNDGQVMESPLIRSIAVPITAFFLLSGITYGLVSRSITKAADVPEMMAEGLKTMLPMIVLFFAVSQFLAWFQWSNLGQWTSIRGAELLQVLDLPNWALFAVFVLLVGLLNLFITSGSAQWALMAPVVVPIMMYLGVSPEVSQMLFRIGDSPTNIITPMSPYFALALTFLQRYYSKAGVGTLMSLALPYSMAMMGGWFIFFLAWYYLGIPLGPGSPMEYPAV
ncbi:AbgT family transporter [Corynebacterium cystitidis]|uniref:Aminobenzoyl-glutamate transport protein n=1 Tax=Corynebacterium cystitidis DSM 20524 TaxID=1121357 RepID=A0A1H9UZ72_9CORY|nr:AbgT family transporter [Corynebacterium cystitidis]WJY83640.1 p-aminobenzoyl-glutamate transport protein [Corynebacterium cystitidis DSM 20524]SES14424.1 aminobenzoyl-glutamate transport protein [Corynebacterium cystitidis DSM 20524]SNV91583.1 Aminobenzoyl-glutamate transport protein [Corynebacterium cystitidis]